MYSFCVIECVVTYFYLIIVIGPGSDFNLLGTSGDPSQQLKHSSSNTWIAAIAKLVALSCVVLWALRFTEEYRAVGCGSEAFASRLVDTLVDTDISNSPLNPTISSYPGRNEIS